MSAKNRKIKAINRHLNRRAKQTKSSNSASLSKHDFDCSSNSAVYSFLLFAALNNPGTHQATMEISELLGQSVSTYEVAHLSINGRNFPLGARISRQGRTGAELLARYGFNDSIVPNRYR